MVEQDCEDRGDPCGDDDSSEPIESAVDTFEPAVDTLEPAVEAFESSVDTVQALVHLIEGTFDVGDTSFKWMRVH